MKLDRLVIVGCLVPMVAACSDEPPRPALAGPAYSCWEPNDVDQQYQPGQTLVLHWIVRADSPRVGARTPGATLHARLTGPYADIGALKSDSGRDDVEASDIAAAPPLHPSGGPGERPTSSIVIPSTAAPGLYTLFTSVTIGAAVVTGAGVVRVIPKI